MKLESKCSLMLMTISACLRSHSNSVVLFFEDAPSLALGWHQNVSDRELACSDGGL